MYLDLGQKNFGHRSCPTCNMVGSSLCLTFEWLCSSLNVRVRVRLRVQLFTLGQSEDDKTHKKYCEQFAKGVVWKGWAGLTRPLHTPVVVDVVHDSIVCAIRSTDLNTAQKREKVKPTLFFCNPFSPQPL
jgi:hypothetical protein